MIKEDFSESASVSCRLLSIITAVTPNLLSLVALLQDGGEVTVGCESDVGGL